MTRRTTSIMTAFGMGLVVFVFVSILMLAEGLEKTLVSTGSPENVVVIRRSSVSEVQSGIDRLEASIVETQPEAAVDLNGRAWVAKELVVLITLKKKGSEKAANVIIRGVSEESLSLRPKVKVIAGRVPRFGTSEIMTGKNVAERFFNAGLNDHISFATREWTVVGVFDAEGTGFDSEIWGDVTQMMQAFRRPVYSSILFRLKDAAGGYHLVKERLENDPRLHLEAKRETTYYLEQSEMMATFLRVLGISLTVVFSLGAIVGAMITMYAAVANRTREIGTLMALGFKKRMILLTFLTESLLLGLVGGLVGLFLASFLQLISISTTNFQTFSELAFHFVLSPKIAINAVIFSLIMGAVGGILPALRAARSGILNALRGE